MSPTPRFTAPPVMHSVGGDAYIGPGAPVFLLSVGTGVLPRPITGALLVPVRRGDPRGRPREGKSAKRRQWRMKRAGFEEVPRLAGTTVPVSRLARRWAREPLPYAPQGTHRAGRTGADDPTAGTDSHVASLLGMTGFFRCHCEPVTDVTGVAIRNTPYAAATFPV